MNIKENIQKIEDKKAEYITIWVDGFIKNNPYMTIIKEPEFKKELFSLLKDVERFTTEKNADIKLLRDAEHICMRGF